MVIAAGTLRKAREAEEYSQKVFKLEKIIKDNNLNLSDKAKSLNYKASIFGGLGLLSGMLFGTAAFGAPVLGYMTQNFANYLGYEYGENILGATVLTYFFCSGIIFAICGGLNEHYAEKYLDELKKHVSGVAINYNIW